MLRSLAPLLLLTAAIGAFLHDPLTQGHWIWDPDVVNQVLVWFDLQARLWHRGEWPLWDPYLWMGQPLFGQVQPGAAYPLNWLLFASPLDGGHLRDAAPKAYFLAIHWMTAASGYVLLRGVGRSRTAAAMGGCVWSVTGLVGTTAWPQWLNGAVWAPLVIHHLLRAARPDGLARAAAAGAMAGIGWLAGHHQIPLLTMFAGVGLIAGEAWRGRRVRAAASVAIFASMAFAVGAAQILPAIEYGWESVRWVGLERPVSAAGRVPYEAHRKLSLPPSSIAGFVLPEPQRVVDPFCGVVVMSMAAVGLATRWRSWRLRTVTALGGVALLYALGGYTPLQRTR